MDSSLKIIGFCLCLARKMVKNAEILEINKNPRFFKKNAPSLGDLFARLNLSTSYLNKVNTHPPGGTAKLWWKWCISSKSQIFLCFCAWVYHMPYHFLLAWGLACLNQACLNQACLNQAWAGLAWAGLGWAGLGWVVLLGNIATYSHSYIPT